MYEWSIVGNDILISLFKRIFSDKITFLIHGFDDSKINIMILNKIFIITFLYIHLS